MAGDIPRPEPTIVTGPPMLPLPVKVGEPVAPPAVVPPTMTAPPPLTEPVVFVTAAFH